MEEEILHNQSNESKARRARNRAYGLAELRKCRVHITVRNKGAHLIVRKGSATFDYYPGTGSWRLRKEGYLGTYGRADGRGIASLKQRLSQIEISKL